MHLVMTSRRTFLRMGAFTSFTVSVLPDLISRANKHLIPTNDSHLSKGQTILFQGDSITDAGRGRGNYYANDGYGMGLGYVHQIAAELLGHFPEKDYRIYNRGISGHKVFQLAARWEDDCLQLKPDVLSLLIGVNDYWHTMTHNYQGTAATFENDLRALITRTQKSLPDIRLIICEPFAVEGGTALNDQWGAFDAYRQSVKEISKAFNATFIPFHRIFKEALKLAPVEYWCPDGVHPSMAGSYLMKEAWLAAYKL